MKHFKFLLLLNFIMTFSTSAADLPAMIEFYKANYQKFYQQRFCGRNIEQLISNALKEGIDLSHSYVLKIEGAGFFETSGFYTRSAKNQRDMLGYFHIVFVADNYVFDFDLADRLVVSLENYVRLQFTPPYEPFYIFGVSYLAQNQLPWWKVTAFETTSYISNKPIILWSKKLGDVIDLNKTLSAQRM